MGLCMLRWCVMIFCLAVSSSASKTQPITVNIGLLADLHGPLENATSSESSSGYRLRASESTQGACRGKMRPLTAQHVLAARWAIDVINNQSTHQGVRLGLEVFDTCSSKDVAMRDVFFAVKHAMDTKENTQPLMGLIGLGDPTVLSETLTTLHAFNIPLILASPRLTQVVKQQGNILTTAPDMNSVISPVLAIAKQLGATAISLISSCSQSTDKFTQETQMQGMFLGRLLELKPGEKALPEKVKIFLDDAATNEIIAIIIEPEEIYTAAQYLGRMRSKKFTLIAGTIGLNKNVVQLWSNIFENGYLVEPHMSELPDFRNYLLGHLQAAVKSNDNLTKEYIASTYNCDWANERQIHTDSCDSLTATQLGNQLQIDTEVTFVVKAISAYSAALFLVQAEHCMNITECRYKPSHSLQLEVMSMLDHLSFTSKHKAPFELQGTSLHLTPSGQLIANKYTIHYISSTGDLTVAGWYSDDQGLVMDFVEEKGRLDSHHHSEKQGRGFSTSKKTSNTKLGSIQKEPPVLVSVDDSSLNGVQRFTNTHLLGDEGSGVNARKVTPESYIARTWATVLVGVAAIGTVVTLFMLVYVLMKICDGTLSGNQSLGVILLLGIMVIYGSVVLFVLPGSSVRCTLRAILHPTAMSLCYGILIIKVMQLRSLVLLGLGGRISYINQYIILFFIVLVEVVIILQWLMTNKPHFRVDKDGTPYCYMPQSDFLLLHIYLAILVVLAFLYGLSVLKIRRNYKEGRWVTLAALLSMPVMAIWGLVVCLVPDEYSDPTMSVALVLLATILIVALFIPKMNTIAKQNSHFKHKKMQMADSVTTIFTTYTDINSSAMGTRKKILRHPNHFQHFHTQTSDAYADNITKNPIYEVTHGAYP